MGKHHKAERGGLKRSGEVSDWVLYKRLLGYIVPY